MRRSPGPSSHSATAHEPGDRSLFEASKTGTGSLKTSRENVQRFLAPPADIPTHWSMPSICWVTCTAEPSSTLAAARRSTFYPFDISESLVKIEDDPHGSVLAGAMEMPAPLHSKATLLTRVEGSVHRTWMAFLRRRKGGRLAAHVNLQVTTSRNGCKVVIPLLGGIGFDNLVVSESWMDHILPRLLERKAGAFVDVGANVGQTLLKVKTLAPDVEYVGFEPNPVCFNYTRRLITSNGFHRCTLLPVGVSKVTRVVPLFGRSEADVSGSVVPGFRPTTRSPFLMYVAVFHGAELVDSLGTRTIGVLKVDVEGGELEVLEGLRSVIDRDRPFIMCEILPLFSSRTDWQDLRAKRQDQLLSVIRAADYRMYRILEDATIQPISDVDRHSDMALTNYLFAPAEDSEYIDLALVAASDSRAPLELTSHPRRSDFDGEGRYEGARVRKASMETRS